MNSLRIIALQLFIAAGCAAIADHNDMSKWPERTLDFAVAVSVALAYGDSGRHTEESDSDR